MAKYDDTEWFRSSRWNADIKSTFEAKLRSARVWSRTQYIRIQATHLSHQDDPALRDIGRTLFRRVINEYGESDSHEALTASEQLANSLAADGRVAEALAAFRATLDLIATSPTKRSGTTGVTELALAELLISRGTAADLYEAERLLELITPEVDQQSFLRDVVLRHAVAQARVQHRLGLPSAATSAQRALAVAEETAPGLPRHPDLSRPHADQALQSELMTITSTQLENRQGAQTTATP